MAPQGFQLICWASMLYYNMNKYKYLLVPSITLTQAELDHRLDVIMELGIPLSNIKIQPNTQQNIPPDLYQSRLEQWRFKVLGAYVGTNEYIKNSLNSKIEGMKNLADILLKFPSEIYYS